MDEELFFEAIIASERVARWMEDLRAGTAAAKALAAANDTNADAGAATTTTTTAAAARDIATAAKAAHALARAVAAENMCGGPYSEAAEDQGAPRALTALMSRLCAGGDDSGDDEEDDEEHDSKGDGKKPNKSTTQTSTALLVAAARRDALAAAGRAMAALSGPMACGGRVVSFSADALRLPPRGRPLRVREGAISDGLGARVWALAHLALRELCAHPSLVRGRSVLEIGAGTGLLGVVAARLGAVSVVVSDHEPTVLRILRACAHLNAAAVEEARGVGGDFDGGDGDGGDRGSDGLPSVHSSEAETVSGSGGGGNEEEDGDDGNDGNKEAAAAATATALSWDVAGGALCVRAFDWADSLAALDGEEAAAPLRLVVDSPDPLPPAATATTTAADLPPPTLPPDHEPFDVVLGSEVMYEPEHARLVAAALAHRLARPGGVALLACAGRFAGVFEAFARHCRERGLRYRAAPVRPTAADYSDGILARHRAAAAGGGGGVAVMVGGGASPPAAAAADAASTAPASAAAAAATPASAASSRVEYEGGFLLMAVDWGQGEWHRDDFVEGLVDGSGAPIETV